MSQPIDRSGSNVNRQYIPTASFITCNHVRRSIHLLITNPQSYMIREEMVLLKCNSMHSLGE